MTSLTDNERTFLGGLSELTYCNPFGPQRIELERAVLGDAYRPEPSGSWSRIDSESRLERPNVRRISQRAASLCEQLLSRQSQAGSLQDEDALLYDDLVTYVLYYEHLAGLSREQLEPSPDDSGTKRTWKAFADDRERMLAPLDATERQRLLPSPHLFALVHQVRRAFHWIYDCLIGESRPATRLRAAVWQSIFTHDMRRYRRTLYQQMGQFATLVTGPSGAGKELVAQAIGRSQYRPFHAKAGGFAGQGELFTALNLSALSPTLIESELFGHRRGAFTGADADRVGWLERCPAHGAVFLDEIGELDAAIQVKLLRVAQSRDYSRLGESELRRFDGKLLAATNRDLAAEMRAGRFREDLYYRLCSDHVVVPSLAEQLADNPEGMSGLIRFLGGRVLGSDDDETSLLVAEVETVIAEQLPRDYAWPGNMRELEQCIRGVLVRRDYAPPQLAASSDHRPSWLKEAEAGRLSADQLISAYCRHVHGLAGGYEQASRILGLDRRTVKSRVNG